jgi:hypothetical protein
MNRLIAEKIVCDIGLKNHSPDLLRHINVVLDNQYPIIYPKIELSFGLKKDLKRHFDIAI